MDTATPSQLEDRLLDVLRATGPMVVALSGGVDSALLSVAARRALGGEKVLAMTADSASLASDELDHCRRLTEQWDIDWQPTPTHEFDDPRYLANNGDRCFWCKSALMDVLEPVATRRAAVVALGVNVDDLGDHRPGQEAARQRGARFPLVEAGFSKSDVRSLAHAWGLEVWDRPAMPCLSSRVPYHTPVTIDLVSRIDRAERVVRSLGFSDVRVRHYDETARIEVPEDDLARAVAAASDLVAGLTALGYQYVTLDLAGLRSGNLNAALGADPRD